MSDEAERSADQRNRERFGEEPPSTPKKGDEETKAGRPSPEGKARTPEAKPADHQEKVRLRKQTGEKEKLHPISISVKNVSEGTEKREKLFFCLCVHT